MCVIAMLTTRSCLHKSYDHMANTHSWTKGKVLLTLNLWQDGPFLHADFPTASDTSKTLCIGAFRIARQDLKHENNTSERRIVLRSSILWPRVTLSESKTLLITPADPPAYRPPGHCSVLRTLGRHNYRNSPTLCSLFEASSRHLNLGGYSKCY